MSSAGNHFKKRIKIAENVENVSLFEWANFSTHSPLARISNLLIENDSTDSEQLNRYVVSSKSIASGEEICFIPKDMLLSVSRAKETNLGKDIAEKFEYLEDVVSEKYNHAIDIICLAAYMVQQKQSASSYWYPYLKSLPQSYLLPVCWSECTIKSLLKGTGLEFITLERKKWLQNCVLHLNSKLSASHFPNGHVTNEEFLWAFCSITSRAFPKSDSSRQQNQTQEDWISLSEICLYPVLDMLNHKRNQKIEWIMSDEGVGFIAREPIEAGAEIFNNYGSKGNENLLGNYGFVLKDNPEDYFKIVLNTNQDDDCLQLRKKNFKIKNLSHIHLIFLDEKQISEKLLQAADVMVANKVELRIMLKVTSYESPKLRLSSLNTLLDLIERKHSCISEPVNMDQLKESDYIIDNASIYRKGQQMILSHYMDMIKLEKRKLIDTASYLKIDSLAEAMKFPSIECDLDAFTATALAIIGLRNNTESWSQELHMKTADIKFDASFCKKILGTDYFDDYKLFHREEILPLKKAYPELFSESIYSKEACLWAFTLLTLHFHDTHGLMTMASNAPQLCMKMTEFSTCSNTANLQISNCSAQQTGGIQADLYKCLCTAQESNLACYSICNDDPQLVLQASLIRPQVSEACSFASAFQTSSSSSISSSTTSSSSSISSSTTSSSISTSTFSSSDTFTISSTSSFTSNSSTSRSISNPSSLSTTRSNPPTPIPQIFFSDNFSVLPMTKIFFLALAFHVFF